MQRSEVGNIGLHLARIGAELDRFLEFRDGDAVRRRDSWTSSLQRPLPEQGIGAQAVVDELAETVIPNGARMAAPGFSSWITTGPDTVAVVGCRSRVPRCAPALHDHGVQPAGGALARLACRAVRASLC